MILISLASLALAIGFRSIAELQQHGKLKGQKDDASFWGEKSWFRKYKLNDRGHPTVQLERNWYNRAFNVDFKERWPTSATFTVMFTDGMHMCQSISFILLATSVSIALSLNFFIVWGIILGVHFATYRLLQK